MKTILACIFLCISNLAFSAEDDHAGVAYYKELDSLRSQNVILIEQLKRADLLNKIKVSGKPATEMPVDPKASVKSPMKFVMLAGVGKDISALISMPDGTSLPVHVGSSVPSYGVVKSISLEEIVIAGPKQDMHLLFSGGN